MAPTQTAPAGIDSLNDFYKSDTHSLETSELENLLELGRATQYLLDFKMMEVEGELMSRQPDRISSEEPLNLCELVRKLHDTARSLQAVDVGKADVDELHRSIGVLVAAQKSQPNRIYQELLEDVQIACGAATEAVCMIAFTENDIRSTTPRDRRRIVEYLKAAQRTLKVPVLGAMVQRGRMPMVAGESVSMRHPICPPKNLISDQTRYILNSSTSIPSNDRPVLTHPTYPKQHSYYSSPHPSRPHTYP